VWFDALISYMTAVKEDGLWPAELHLIGKDILRFHAVYWPAFLMAADLPLPGKLFAHGWILKDSVKMSKSRGNVVRPEPLRQVIGADPMRYFLLREIPFGQDGNFSYDSLITRVNADLANGLGNLSNRTLTMIRQYRAGVIPAGSSNAGIAEEAAKAIAAYRESFERFEFHRALETLWALIGMVDRAIVEYQPWTLAKSSKDGAAARLDEILYTAAEVVRIATVLLHPLMPDATGKLWPQLGQSSELGAERIDRLAWGQLPSGQAIGEVAAVFPRVDATAAIERIQEMDDLEVDRLNVLLGRTEAPAAAAEAQPWVRPEGVLPPSETITIDDFVKVDLRVGKVLAAEAVKGADKLLHLTVDIAEEKPRTIVAGIAKAYAPEQLIGRKVAIVANLAPRKLRGIESQGMIVAASLEGGSPVLAAFLEDIPVGARLK
jgi:methionyl-tRNA synthetase